MSEEEGKEVLGGNPAGDVDPAQSGSPAGAPSSDWRSGLPEDMRENPALQDFSSVEALAGSFINTKAMVGRDKIVMPQTEEQWDDTFNRLGRPESADDYKFGAIPEEDAVVAELLKDDQKWFGEIAHKAGLSQTQAEKLFGEYTSRVTSSLLEDENEKSAEEEAALEVLAKEWGHNYDANLAVADRAVRHLGGDELMGALIDTGANGNPLIMKAFLQLGEMMREEIGIDKNGSEVYTTDQLRDQMSSIQEHPGYMDKMHPDHGRLVKQMLKLNERIYGTDVA